MAKNHRYWLVIYGGKMRRFEKLESALRYLAHHDAREGEAILVGVD